MTCKEGGVYHTRVPYTAQVPRDFEPMCRVCVVRVVYTFMVVCIMIHCSLKYKYFLYTYVLIKKYIKLYTLHPWYTFVHLSTYFIFFIRTYLPGYGTVRSCTTTCTTSTTDSYKSVSVQTVILSNAQTLRAQPSFSI